MLKVLETFSGIGSQAQALRNINANFEIVNTVEWDISAILAYNFIHSKNNSIKKELQTDESLIDKELAKLGLSMDGKKPITTRSIKQLSKDFKKDLYFAIKNTNNLVNIMNVKEKDIPDGIDILTYSFPCQDLSLCGCWHGNKTGISKDVKNRSGMLWEIERILLEMHEKERQLPKFLLMENVTNILSKSNEKDFNNWKETLKNLGYYNHIYVLNSRDFGNPQKRNRAYMISIQYNDINTLKKIQDYFYKNNLERTQKNIKKTLLSDLIKYDYTNPTYKTEAEENIPNDTPSRRMIWNENDKIIDNKGFHEIIVNTITTKQDRNPNSGVIYYKNEIPQKSQFRYLTPRECFLLMGFKEDAFEKVINNNISITKKRKIFTNQKLIKLAGNSIVINVLEEIFKQIIEIDTTVLKN